MTSQNRRFLTPSPLVVFFHFCLLYVGRFQKNLVILYQSGETQIWLLVKVLGAFHHRVDCNYEHSGKVLDFFLQIWPRLLCSMYYSLLDQNTQISLLRHQQICVYMYTRKLSSILKLPFSWTYRGKITNVSKITL